jgi:hypothetical protein
MFQAIDGFVPVSARPYFSTSFPELLPELALIPESA